jgi:hypothetical protein
MKTNKETILQSENNMFTTEVNAFTDLSSKQFDFITNIASSDENS